MTRNIMGAPGLTALSSTLGVILLLLSPIHRISAQTVTAPQPSPPTLKSPFALLVAEYVHRSTDGHSPSSDEISAMESLTPAPGPMDIHEALPELLTALESRDTSLRTFALTTLVGLGAAPATPGPPSSPETVIPIFKPEVAKVLLPAIPAVLKHLTDDAPENRTLTLSFVARFTGHPPAELYPPLLAYLQADAAVSATGLGVATALLSLGPLAPETAAALVRFMRRPDARDLRSEFVDIVSTAPNQSQDINANLVRYLDSDDPSLRARLILSLPQLDLASSLFADTKARIAQLAENANENLQVITAAKAVAPCWTATRMTTGCPVYH